MNTYAVIMAGGRGERLWPASTYSRPKPLLPLAPGGRSLIRATSDRVMPLVGAEGVRVVTDEGLAPAVAGELGLALEQLIVEPEGRNTAPAVGLAAAVLMAQDPDALMIVLPADHLVEDEEEFRCVLQAGVEAAQKGHLVTLGVRPSFPATGYGYIRRGERLAEAADRQVFRAERFVEKPDSRTAQAYLDDGRYSWNAGIFVWRAARLLEEARGHLPGLAGVLQEVMRGADPRDVWGEVESISIDYGIMEKASDVAVIPVDMGWSDVGDWHAVWQSMPRDEAEVASMGRHIGEETRRTLVWASPNRTVATLGVEDLVIVDTPEALLICDRGQTQGVRDLARRARPELPDWAELRKVDADGMLDAVRSFPAQCREALAAGVEIDLPIQLSGFDRILCVGMGGSGIAGDVLGRLVDAPVHTCRGYDIPEWLGPDALLIAVSYSGNTEETLSAFSQGLRRTRRAIGLCSGGELAELCNAKGVPCVQIPQGYQPRAALGHLVFTLLPALERLGAQVVDVTHALSVLEDLATELSPDTAGNEAQRLALALHRRVPLVYGAHGSTEVAAMRWKTQINENAKQPAFWDALPELCHNEIVGYELAGQLMPQSAAVFLRSPFDHPRITKRIELVNRAARDRGHASLEVWGRGDDPIAQLLSLLYMGDWVSVYLALLNAVDPTPVGPIEDLKRALGGSES